MAAVLAADADMQVGLDRAAPVHGQLHQLAKLAQVAHPELREDSAKRPVVSFTFHAGAVLALLVLLGLLGRRVFSGNEG